MQRKYLLYVYIIITYVHDSLKEFIDLWFLPRNTIKIIWLLFLHIEKRFITIFFPI